MKSSNSCGTEYELFIKRVYERLLATEGLHTIKIQQAEVIVDEKNISISMYNC